MVIKLCASLIIPNSPTNLAAYVASSYARKLVKYLMSQIIVIITIFSEPINVSLSKISRYNTFDWSNFD